MEGGGPHAPKSMPAEDSSFDLMHLMASLEMFYKVKSLIMGVA